MSININNLKECLNIGEREELGIPIITDEIGNQIFEIGQWALEGKPEEGRQMWFTVGNAKDLVNQLPKHMKCRILPVIPDQLENWLSLGIPCHSLLLLKHGYVYSDPNLTLSKWWKDIGEYYLCEEFKDTLWNLWFWRAKRKSLKLFGMDHHHAVLWDAKQILRPLGIKLDFIWLSDGRDPVNEAIPSSVEGFNSSIDIYKGELVKPLNEKLINQIKDKYDGIITSHSIITSYRLSQITELPLFHINSTRFGNEWIQDKNKHNFLCGEIQKLLLHGRLKVIHNNKGDQTYFRNYFMVEPNQELYIPSLSYSKSRICISKPNNIEQKFLLWDPRQTMLQQKSPFMSNLFMKLKNNEFLKDKIDSQAILMSENGSYLPEGYLDKYTAIIHLPYNISTMSIFEQTRSNIPVWIPSKKLLEELWNDINEPNELSWTIFKEGSEKNAGILDNSRNREVIRHWISLSDFYPQTQTQNSLFLHFDSIDDLINKIETVDYNLLITKSKDCLKDILEDIHNSWKQVIESVY